MITQNYPYTDYHNLNLDWVISKIKEFEERVNNIESDILEQAKEYVDEQLKLAIVTLEADYNNFVNEVNDKTNNSLTSFLIRIKCSINKLYRLTRTIS